MHACPRCDYECDCNDDDVWDDDLETNILLHCQCPCADDEDDEYEEYDG